MLNFIKLVTLSKKCLLFSLFPLLLLILISGCSSSKPVIVNSAPQVTNDPVVDSIPTPIPFQKDVDGLLKDLQHTVTPVGGISTVGPNNTYPYALTFGTNDRNSSIQFIELSKDAIQEFRIDKIVTDMPAGTAKVTAYLDVKYTVSGRAMQINGNMQSKGAFVIEYSWLKNADGKYSWTYKQVNPNSSTLVAVKL
ncbi:MAG: hypothetical protein ACYDEJ_17210 [Desulfitobacteriaceae bacterium]